MTAEAEYSFVCIDCEGLFPCKKRNKRYCSDCQQAKERSRLREKGERRKLQLRERTASCSYCGMSFPRSLRSKVRHCPTCLPSHLRRRRHGEGERRAERAGRTYLARDERNRLRIERREAERQARLNDRESNRKPWNAPGLSSGAKWAIRYKLDSEFNLRERLRSQLRDRRKTKRFEEGLRSALNGKRSGKALAEELGYSISDLKVHFERQFTRGMTWEAFSEGRIHIDHIVPLSQFDLSRPEEVKAAWALTNLRPMWAKDNLAKAATRIHLL